MSKREPWPHICEECGDEFLNGSYNAPLCPACRKKHRKAKNLESVKAYQARNREKVRAQSREYKLTHAAEVKSQRAEYYQKNKEKERARKRIGSKKYYAEHREDIIKKNVLRQKVARGDKQAQLELAKLQGKALFCERMRVTAMNLPCGKRDECWHGKPCPRTVELGLTPPKRRELFDFGRWG